MYDMMLHKHESEFLSLFRGQYISKAVFYSSNNVSKTVRIVLREVIHVA